jgi:hypothetical protein
MLRFLRDTGCVIAAQEPDDAHHDPCARLVRLGAVGRVQLMVAPGAEDDLERAFEERRQRRQAWLSDRAFIGRMAGPFTLDVSRFDSGTSW